METRQNMDMSPEKKEKKSVRKHILKTIVILVIGFFLGGFFMLHQISMDDGLIIKKMELLGDLTGDNALYDFDREAAEAGVCQGYLKGLSDDDYAQYYTKEEYDELVEADSGEYQGIGVSVYKDEETEFLCVGQVFKGNPAYNAGVKIGDLIVKINDKETADMTLSEAVSCIKSPDYDEVTLTILRDGEETEILVKKTDIEMDTVSYEMKEDKIGYISITEFIENTPKQFEDAICHLLDEGMESLIIDLRDNGGGILESCIDMVSRIIPKDELIVYTEDKNGKRVEYNSNSDETLDVPIIMLINQYTASASEIMTGCLKDYGKAQVVGVTSFGKGIVQRIFPLSDGSAVKFTVSTYYTPKGNDIHKKGIEPDFKVEITEDEWMEAMEDPSKDKQLKKAIEILKEQ